ncbi:hypothetical protein FB567DRAFT_581167, partial [Paraphoma chrysanthemicola]
MSAFLTMQSRAVILDGHDSCWHRVYLRAKDLFVESKTHSTIGCIQYTCTSAEQSVSKSSVVPRSRGFSVESVDDITGLDQLLRTDDQVATQTPQQTTQLFFISQTTSWSRLRILADMFNRLVQYCNAFDEFSAYLLQFGKRIRDAPEIGLTSHLRLHTAKTSVIDYEICYNIKHFEKHDRELQDPWSCRHAAFYQRFSSVQHSSTWIIVQGPSKIQSFLERSISTEATSSFNHYEHPLYLHVQFMVILERNWTAYLATLEQRRCKTADKILFLYSVTSSVGLDDIHDIHNVQARLRTAIAILEGIVSLIN